MSDFPFNAFDRHECALLAEACNHLAEMYEANYAEAEADGEGGEFGAVAADAVQLRKMAAAFEKAERSKLKGHR